MVSRDAMRSWSAVDAAIVAAGQGVSDFFYRPDSGELLADAFDVNTLDRRLWHSADGGAHWVSCPLPPLSDSGFWLLGVTYAGALLSQPNGPRSSTLYRLPSGGDQWQVFDTAPGDNVSTTYIPSPSAGVLWAIPTPPYYYTPFDPTGRIYTKDYAA